MHTDVRVQRKKVLVIKQILFVSTLGNVWRIHILMLGREGLMKGNQSELPTRPNELTQIRVIPAIIGIRYARKNAFLKCASCYFPTSSWG